jgi:hypothetical protein
MRTKNILVAVTLAVVATVSGAAHATAAPAFAAQARTLGLSATQAADLQQEVAGYLGKLGGTQVAVNKIDLGNGGFVLLALPGETYARDLERPSVRGAASCPYLFLCAFKRTNFNGNIIAIIDCNVPENIPWFTTGSYVNNQTPGTVGTFHLTNGNDSRTGGAYYQRTPWNWATTNSITACED